MLAKHDLRYTAKEVLNHPWMEIDDSHISKLSNINYSSLKAYRGSKKLKKAALTYIASQLSEKEIQNLSGLFERLDTNNDGLLSFEEIKAGIHDFNAKNGKEVQQVLEGIDTDHSGMIDYTGIHYIY